MVSSLRGNGTGRRILMLALLMMTMCGVLWAGAPSPVRAQQERAGMLAVVGADGNLSVYDFDAGGQTTIRLTTDGDRARRIYTWPTWATDGRLAFFGASVDPSDRYSLRVFVQRVVTDETPRIAYSSRAEVFTYAYWAPGDCGRGDCRDLALLFTPPVGNQLGVRLIRDDEGAFTDRVIGAGAPFYYSFSPDGQRMLWHRAVGQFEVLEIYDVEADQSTVLPDRAGRFAAPMWSPIDGRLLFATAAGTDGRADLVIADGEQRQVLLPAVETPISFAWSPDATRVASVARAGRLVVTDAASGDLLMTTQNDHVLAYFWSPEGDRIAFAGVARDVERSARPGAKTRSTGDNEGDALAQNRIRIAWRILDVATGEVTPVESGLPTDDMIYYLRFFDQFSRSHNLWSPDGRYLAYGVLEADGQPAVRLADTRAPGSLSTIPGSTIGIWSWR